MVSSASPRRGEWNQLKTGGWGEVGIDDRKAASTASHSHAGQYSSATGIARAEHTADSRSTNEPGRTGAVVVQVKPMTTAPPCTQRFHQEMSADCWMRPRHHGGRDSIQRYAQRTQVHGLSPP